MSIFGKLKEVIKIDIHHLININIVQNESSKDKLRILEDGKRVEINKTALEDEEWEEAKKILHEHYNKNGATFLEEKATERVDDIKEKLNLRTTKEILEFYKGKISPWHFDALEASLYLRETFKEGHDIEDMKCDIIHKFGHEGKNICHLCSSGYFEGYIKELYVEMSRHPDFTLDKFQRRFKEIVRDSPFAVYVSHHKKSEDIKEEIDLKLTKFQNYGINFLGVHGLGVENVKKIRETIQSLENERDDIKIEMVQEPSIIQAKIMFK